MQLDECLDHRQAQARTARAPSEAALHLSERRHCRRDVVGSHAHARVAHGDHELATGFHARLNIDAAAIGGELDRVGNKIDQRLLELSGIAAERDEVIGADRFESNAGVLRTAPHHAQAGGDALADIDRRLVELEHAGVGFRHVEDVVDDAQEVRTTVLDSLGIIEIFGVAERPIELGRQYLGEADDGIERRTRLVADMR